MSKAFGARLHEAMAAHGPLCAGIDPHRALVEAWGLTYDVAGLERFALTCVEAFAGRVAVVKPQSAFFEVFGSRGLVVLERVLTELREAGTLTILDAKRGDIGSTMAAYAAGLPGTGRRRPAGRADRESLPRLRVAAPRDRPRGADRARALRPRPDLEPGGRRRPARRAGRRVRRGVDRPRRPAATTPLRGPGASSGASVSSSVRRSAARSTTSGSTSSRPRPPCWRPASARRAGPSSRSRRPSAPRRARSWPPRAARSSGPDLTRAVSSRRRTASSTSSSHCAADARRSQRPDGVLARWTPAPALRRAPPDR